ncbi:GntR family transcriptional regulator [Plantibacter sp. Mn2098]|uniref:GntR family transcriptional regulator n=1 Tax=Plantibacter sp. Mn2098 TaxID=3395266 RepID=UPI003BD2B6D7
MPVPQNSPRLDRTSLRDDVYRRLREDIVAGVYLPGERLRESMIEARMGASRTPVREALSRLDADGFVDVLPQRETRVRDVGSQEICDAIIVLRHVFGTQVQLAVESHDAAMLERIRAYHALIVEDLLAEARAIAEGDALGELLDAFLGVAGNPTLQRAVRAIALHLRWYANTTPGLATHLGVGAARVADMLSACERGDVERVRGLFDAWFAQVLRVLAEPAPVRVAAEFPKSLVKPRQLLREQVYVVLLDALRRTEFASGERLREDQLLSWLGVSRVPLRDALGRLELIGLVETLPGRMTRVAVLDVDQLSWVMSALGVFAGLAMRLGVPKICVEDIAQVRLARARLDEALAAEDVIEGIAAVIDALMVVVDASENQSLVTILLSLTPWIYRRTQLRPAPDLRLLDDVLAGLEDGIDRRDAGAAARAVVAYFDQVAVRVGRATPVIMVDDAGVRTDE